MPRNSSEFASLASALCDKEQRLGLTLYQLFSPIAVGVGETYGDPHPRAHARFVARSHTQGITWVKRAHELSEDGHVHGKLVLTLAT
jgi:hypothetical protein